jgi:hypothetical protein
MQRDETNPSNSNSTFVEYCIRKLVSRVDGFPFTVLNIRCDNCNSNNAFPGVDITLELNLRLNDNRLTKPGLFDRHVPSFPPLLQRKAACNLRAALFAELQHAMLYKPDEIRDVAPFVHPLSVKFYFPLPVACCVSRITV